MTRGTRICPKEGRRSPENPLRCNAMAQLSSPLEGRGGGVFSMFLKSSLRRKASMRNGRGRFDNVSKR